MPHSGFLRKGYKKDSFIADLVAEHPGLEDVLERSERGVEGAAQTALGEGQGGDTTVPS
jgi:hypothetical protein